MIRVLFGSALPVLSLGLAAAFLGGGILSEPRGEPLVVAASGAATLQNASFDASACASTLLFADGSSPNHEGAPADAQLVAFRVHDASGYELAIAVEEPATATEPSHLTVLFVVDENGRVTPPSAELLSSADLGGCLPQPDPTQTGPV